MQTIRLTFWQSPYGDSDNSKHVSNIYNYIDIKCLNVNLGEINELESISMELVDTCLYKPKNMYLK